MITQVKNMKKNKCTECGKVNTPDNENYKRGYDDVVKIAEQIQHNCMLLFMASHILSKMTEMQFPVQEKLDKCISLTNRFNKAHSLLAQSIAHEALIAVTRIFDRDNRACGTKHIREFLEEENNIQMLIQKSSQHIDAITKNLSTEEQMKEKVKDKTKTEANIKELKAFLKTIKPDFKNETTLIGKIKKYRDEWLSHSDFNFKENGTEYPLCFDDIKKISQLMQRPLEIIEDIFLKSSHVSQFNEDGHYEKIANEWILVYTTGLNQVVEK
jgi:hypothetical protein